MAVKKLSTNAKPRILVVDDSKLYLNEIGNVLSRAGYEVVKADHSPKAIKLLDQSQQPGEKPFAAVLSDYDLFVCEENGVQVTDDYAEIASHLHDKKIKTPMIVMSGEDRTGQIGWMKEKIVVAFLMKPYAEEDKAVFVRKLKEAIAEKQPKRGESR